VDVETRTARTAKPISVAERCERSHAECVKGRQRCVEAAEIIARARTVIARSHGHFRQYQSDVDRVRRTDSDEHDAPRAVVVSGGSDDVQASETAYLHARARKAIVSGKLPAKASYRAEVGRGPGGVCAVCDLKVLPRELEYEVEFEEVTRHVAPTTFRLHVVCFLAWEKERRLARAERL